MKKLYLLIVLSIFLPSIAFAFESKSANFVGISKDEVVEGSFFAQGSLVSIDGVINGDLFCVTQKLEVTGIVNGDIICAGSKLSITGTSTGDVRLIGGEVLVSGTVNKNLNVVSNYFKLDDFAKIMGELFFLSNDSDIKGVVEGDVFGGIRDGSISGYIGKDASFVQGEGFLAEKGEGKFSLLSGATIEGNLKYKSEKDLVIEDGVIVSGEISKEIIPIERERSNANIFWAVIVVFSNILISIVLISLFKNFTVGVINNIKNDTQKSFWFGILAFFIFPITFLILLFTIIGIPVGAILFFIFVGLVLINKSILSILLGQKFLEIIKNKNKDSLMYSAVIGSVVVYLLFALPFVGSVFSSLGLVMVLGATLQYFRININKN